MIIIRMFLFAAAALAAAVLLPACSDDDPPQTGGGEPARVMVVMENDDRTPVAGIKIVVMDPETNVPVAGPRLTGLDGLVSFPELPQGHYPVLAYGGFRYRFSGFHPELLAALNPPRKSSGLTGPGLPGKTSPAPSVPPLVYRAVAVPPDSLPRFSGRIIDAQTGLPLKAAFIGLNPYLTGYQGDTDANDDVSGSDGSFSVSQIPLAVNPDNGNLIQIQPLLVVRHGYRPLYWRYNFPNGSQETDVKNVTIALEPAGPEDSGALSGRIVRGGKPVAGLPVGLALAGLGNKVGPGLTGYGAVTDDEGRYRIKGLPGGGYIVQPGYLVGDGAVFPFPPGFEAFPVMPGAETDAGDLPVLQEISPGQPYEGAVLWDQPTELVWSSVPDAFEYEVRLDRGTLGRVEGNLIKIPEGMELTPGTHVWDVGAFDEADALIGFSQTQFSFRIAEPAR